MDAIKSWKAVLVVDRCLLVDDSPAFLKSARALLHSQGVEVAASASSMEEALAAAARSRFDVALIDVELDGEDGLDLTRELLARDPRLQVILISAYELEDVSDLAAACGAAGFISKTALSRPAIEALLGD